MRRTSAANPLDDDVLAAVHTALNHLGAALWARCAGTAETVGARVADHLGAADHLAGGPQKEIFEDELSIAANKWCAAGAACYLAIISLRPCLAFEDLIKRPAIQALELDCPEHGPPPPPDCFTGKRLLCRRAYEGGAAAVGFDFFAFGLSCQSSDGNVSAKLRKPSTNITAKPVTMVISATKIALADDSLMTRLLSGTPWRTAPGRRPTISSGSLAMLAASALYQVIRAEAGPESGDDEIPCRVCGAPLAPRDGEFVLRYFLLRKAGRQQEWQKRRPVRPASP